MKKNFCSLLFVILFFVLSTVSCKKEDIVPPPDALENTNWSLFQINYYYPDFHHDPEIINSLWSFSSDRKMRIYTPLRYLPKENGEWYRTPDNKIVIDMSVNGNFKYKQTFDIIHKTEAFMQLETKDVHLQSIHGETSKGEYFLYKIE